MRTFRLTFALLVGLFLLPAGASAHGGGNGVHVDPGSPAGKQYSIPLSSARSETAGKHASSTNPPAFGQGVTPNGGGSGASTASPTSSSSTTSSSQHRQQLQSKPGWGPHGGGSGGPSNGATPSGTTQARVVARAAQVGQDAWLPLAGGGALVLLLGCGGGLALRRRL
jgi:hypothetical protein